MTIHVECPECGASRTLKDDAAGRKLKCGCGAAIYVPKRDDDLHDSYERPTLKRLHSDDGTAEDSNQILIYGVCGGGVVVLLLILFIVTRRPSVPAVNVADAQFKQTLPPPPAPTNMRGSSSVGVAPTGSNVSNSSKGAAGSSGNDDSQVTDPGSSRKRKAGSGFTQPQETDEGSRSSRPAVAKRPNRGTGTANWGGALAAKPVFNTEGDKSSIVFADLNPKLVLVDNQLVDVEKGEGVGSFSGSGKSENNVLRALSPDGQTVAAATTSSVETAEVVTLHTIGGNTFGKRLSTNGRGNQSNRVRFLAFPAANRLVAGVECHGSSRGDKIFVFNLETGKVQKEINCTELGEVAALSPDGKYLCNHLREGVPVYDLQRGAKVAAMERPKGNEGTIYRYGECRGLAFSPDGTELAALLNRNRVVVWNDKGKIVFDEILPYEAGNVFEHRADGLQWLPDGQSWLLGSQYLLLRDQKLVVWNIQREWPHDRQPVRILDQKSVLAVVSENTAGDLVRQEIPWDEINRQTDSANLEEIALVKPGEAMSIEVQVFNVRFGNPQEVANILGTTLTRRIEQSKFKVQTGRNVVLKASYTEEQGAQKRVVQGPFFGRDTGQRVNDSKGNLAIKIVKKDTGEVCWEQTIYSDGGSSIQGDINDATVRNQMFKYIEARVNQLALPTLIPKPGALQLPLVTKLEH